MILADLLDYIKRWMVEISQDYSHDGIVLACDLKQLHDEDEDMVEWTGLTQILCESTFGT